MHGGMHDVLNATFLVFLLGNPQHPQFRTAPFRRGGDVTPCHLPSYKCISMKQTATAHYYLIFRFEGDCDPESEIALRAGKYFRKGIVKIFRYIR